MLPPPPLQSSFLSATPICYPLRKTSDEVEDWLNYPLTFRHLALIFASLISLFYFFFSSSSSSSVVACDSPSLRRGGSPCASLNSMCQEIRPLRSATAYPSGIIRSKERFCIPEKKLSKDGYVVSSTEHMNRKS